MGLEKAVRTAEKVRREKGAVFFRWGGNDDRGSSEAFVGARTSCPVSTSTWAVTTRSDVNYGGNSRDETEGVLDS